MAKKESRIKSHDYQRQMLREVVKEVVGEGSDALFKRSLETEDLFDSLYDELDLLQPVYGFDNLYLIYEQSDVLQSCVEAMQQNVDGFGYQMQFLGDDVKDKDKKEALEQRVKAENFFDQVNPEESFMKIRKNAREDLEVLGSMAFECIRNKAGELMMMFHVPFKNLRMSKKESNPVEIEVPLWRNGKLIKVRYKRRFRKWAQVDSVNRKVRWFREFGDQRPMQALTGKIDKNGEQASEILHIKLQFGGMAYGLPRWVGAVLEAIGRRNAQYVNWDLFESQGIPPMAVLVSGGVLTDTSIEELKTIIRSMRGVDKWNRIMLLESSVESVGLDDKGTAKLELKNLSEYRKDDQMFDRYLTSTEKNLRHRFRLPPLYVGGAETFTHATAKAAQNVAEEQVFIPARTEFDEMVNRKLVQNELGIDLWKYTTKGPRIVGASEISSAVEIFGKSGAFTVNHADGERRLRAPDESLRRRVGELPAAHRPGGPEVREAGRPGRHHGQGRARHHRREPGADRVPGRGRHPAAAACRHPEDAGVRHVHGPGEGPVPAAGHHAEHDRAHDQEVTQ